MTRAAGRKTGPTPAGVIARLKANMIARYKLVGIPGRPEELRKPGHTEAVSIQYGAFQIRVRLMDGRKWVKSIDFPVELPDREIRERVFAILDPWFEVMPGLGEQVHDVSTHGGPALDAFNNLKIAGRWSL